MAELVMPRLSDTMEEGTILQWLKREGEPVRRGEELVEIETDKASMVYESDAEGVLEIVAPEGATLAVGEVIARVGAGEAASPAPASSPVAPPTPAGSPSSPSLASSPGTPAGSDSPPASPAGSSSLEGPPPGGLARVKASPLARRVARERGVDLHTLAGSGPGGRIVKADVEAAASSGPTPVGGPPSEALPVEGAPAGGLTGEPIPPGAPPSEGSPSETPTEPPSPAASPSPPALPGVATAKGESVTQEPSRIQQTIARRMAESKATIPHFALEAEIEMDRCVALRAQLKGLTQGEARTASGEVEPGSATPTYNDMVVKACALALREHPRVNGSWRDGRFELHSRVNVGVAVAAQDALVVPTVFDADVKSLGEIARETHALAERVRAGTITPPELGGGTFTVSNLGMFGVRSFTAIINPPQAAILSVGSLEPRAVVRDGEIVARNTMTVTIACDHRILYGADAARFLGRVRELLEEPTALTL